MQEVQPSACCFGSADILLPKNEDLTKWAVIACDQFTSQPEYWQKVRALTVNRVSAAHLILPESELGGECEDTIDSIHRTMLRYLQTGVFQVYHDCYIYTERTLQDGNVRCGIVGKVDLESYDYSEFSSSAVRATERTVQERIPPRMAVRRGAALELPHILLLCDDEQRILIEPLHRIRDELPKLYDFDLMLGGGHVAGWLVSGEEKRVLDLRLFQYAERQAQKYPGNTLLFAVGDGNHSLATAKACYEEWKASQSDTGESPNIMRFALCELNNIHDPVQKFTPIHRLVKGCDVQKLLNDLKKAFAGAQGNEIQWFSGKERGTLILPCESGVLPLAILQNFLDDWLSVNTGELDYIHGDETLQNLSRYSDCLGFLLPALEKKQLFPGILSGGVLPRKTFSMGNAEEKRYYLEARRIL